ncbi:MAG: tRNA (adenosine(37)-N6)-threonylcarbamoyltransferase complex transferase subunit TsaD [Candidatus Buchananbacteria bacterium]
MIILGIESSCDETAAAVVKISGRRFDILGHTISSQINIHKKYGGVVPEVAARNHIINIIPVVEQTLHQAKIQPKQINRVAVTYGPGLITSLMVGLETAKTLSFAWQKPIVAINHMRAHIYANWLENKKIIFPVMCLVVSGGHTELVLIKDNSKFKKVGQTLDDAAGEAFDKVAKLLDVGYPGGPVISRLAKTGNAKAFNLARPMINANNLDFSFSGLKTSVLYAVQKAKRTDQKFKADMCASFQQAAIDVLVSKTIKAAQQYKVKTIMLSGGVSANLLLRQTLSEQAGYFGFEFLMPRIDFCTDNAAMVAVAGYFGQTKPYQKIKVDPNLSL